MQDNMPSLGISGIDLPHPLTALELLLHGQTSQLLSIPSYHEFLLISLQTRAIFDVYEFVLMFITTYFRSTHIDYAHGVICTVYIAGTLPYKNHDDVLHTH